MDVLQWAITTIVGILGILIGREWHKRDRNAQKDNEIYSKILELLPQDDMLFFKRHDFGGPFRRIQIKPLGNFEGYCERSNFIFVDSQLEKQRKELFKDILNFTDLYTHEAFEFDAPVPDLVRIPYPEDLRVKEFKREPIVSRLNELAEKVWNSYDLLIKTARRKL